MDLTPNKLIQSTNSINSLPPLKKQIKLTYLSSSLLVLNEGKAGEMEFFIEERNGGRLRQRAGPPAITNKSIKRRKQTTLFTSFNQLL